MNKIKKNNDIDVTNEKFANKNKISSDKMKHAAGFAIIEAIHWERASDVIYENSSNLIIPICVNALFSIEMYLKSILLNMKINVTEEKFGHDIYAMYCKLDDELKAEIKKDVKIDNEIHKEFFNKVIKFNTFEEELKYISNDFIYLRYEYEKFLNGISIFALTGFIMSIKKNIRELAFKYNYETRVE